MSRPPLLVKSVARRQLYLGGLSFIALACVPPLLLVLGIADFTAQPSIAVAMAGCVLYGLYLIANTYLGYPQMRLSGNRLTVVGSLFLARRYDLAGLGHAYVALYDGRYSRHAVLLFRDAAAEAAHRAAEPYPHEPEREEAAMEIPVDRFVGFDTDKGAALAAEINAHRGL